MGVPLRHHRFPKGIFHGINHPAYWGTPIYGTPHMNVDEYVWFGWNFDFWMEDGNMFSIKELNGQTWWLRWMQRRRLISSRLPEVSPKAGDCTLENSNVSGQGLTQIDMDCLDWHHILTKDFRSVVAKQNQRGPGLIRQMTTGHWACQRLLVLPNVSTWEWLVSFDEKFVFGDLLAMSMPAGVYNSCLFLLFVLGVWYYWLLARTVTAGTPWPFVHYGHLVIVVCSCCLL